MRRLLKWIGLLLVWVVLTYAALEIGLRLTAPSLGGQIGTVARYVTTGQPYSESWQPAWRENRDHYYALRPDVTDVLQYGSPTVSFRLTTHKLWDDGLPPDEGIGFRTRPIDYRVDAVVVGDSFGFCFTEEADCWVTRLAAQTGLGIANLSMPVTGSISHGRILADYGAPLEPPIVIWQFFGNDFNDDYGLLAWRGDIEPLDDAGADDASGDAGVGQWLTQHSIVWALGEVLLTGRWSGTPDSERVFTPQYTAAVNDRGDVLQFGKLYEQRALDMTRPANQFGLEQSRAAFTEAQARVDAWGGELVVVLIPTREEVYAHITEPLMGAEAIARQHSAREAMLGLCDSLRLTCIDPTDAFTARALEGDMLYYRDDMHLNPRGNALLAEIVAGALPVSESQDS
jgi:lysophospholipase L1-like esterase